MEKMQCSVCGQWKMLTRKSGKESGMQTFYPCCGKDSIEHKLPVCDDCCAKVCPNKGWVKSKDRLPDYYKIVEFRHIRTSPSGYAWMASDGDKNIWTMFDSDLILPEPQYWRYATMPHPRID